MTVKELIIELQDKDESAEVFMYFKTPDGKLTFSSEITNADNGAITNEYGQFEKGVLIMKE